MLSKLRIGPKLLLAPGVVLVLLVLVSRGAYYAMVRQNQSLSIIVGQRAASIRAAGEHGSGFAVVASEVRTLARRCAAAAHEIRDLIALTMAEIDGGSASAAEAGYSMLDIVSSVQQVGEIISQISHAGAEQASGIVGVNEAIVQMDEMTQQNSALVEQAAAAAESLQDQAHRLSRAVAAFQLDEGEPRRGHLRLASRRG